MPNLNLYWTFYWPIIRVLNENKYKYFCLYWLCIFFFFFDYPKSTNRITILNPKTCRKEFSKFVFLASLLWKKKYNYGNNKKKEYVLFILLILFSNQQNERNSAFISRPDYSPRESKNNSALIHSNFTS